MKSIIMIAVLSVIMFLSGTNYLQASNQASLGVDSVEMKIEKFKLRVTITQNKSNALSSIILEIDGVRCVVPTEELDAIGSNFDLSGVRLLVGMLGPGEKITASNLDRIGISIPYGNLTSNEIGEYELHSRDEVQFYFSRGILVNRIRVVTMGDHKARWKLYSKEAGQKELEGEIIKGIKNPFGGEIVENE